jgi:hypothetical protein
MASANRHQPDLVAGCALDNRRGHGASRGLDLSIDAIEDIDILVGILGVDTVAIVARPSGEISAVRMHTRQRAIRHAVTVYINVSMKSLHVLELGS